MLKASNSPSRRALLPPALGCRNLLNSRCRRRRRRLLPASLQALLLCLLLAAFATAARAQECPPGLEGPECGMCIGGTALGDEACVNITDYASAFCYSNHTWAEGSTQKMYDCTTEASGGWQGRGACFADLTIVPA